MDNFDKIIIKIHNYMYANDSIDNTEALYELLKILYCKILDEKQKNLMQKEYDDENLLKVIFDLFESIKIKFKNIFDKNEKINLKPNTIIYIIKEIKNINLCAIKSDFKGHILQKIIDRSYRENRGQFFTPHSIVDFMVQMINPKALELGCDPACGTGGFLFEALNHIAKSKNITQKDISNLYFQDISKTLIKLVAMRMMFEYSCNNFNYSIQDNIELNNNNGKYDYIITNPPFGSQGKINNPKILNQYNLAHENETKIIPQTPDILFVERVINLLKTGGRAGIILPYGDFDAPSFKYFREYIINNTKINAVISIPEGAFSPYGTGIKTCIIFFTKTNKEALKKEINKNYKIYFGNITKLGYTFYKHSKIIYKQNDLIDEDYTEILNLYKNKKENNLLYTARIEEIISNNYNLSPNYYHPLYKQEIELIKQGKYAKLKDIVSIKNKKDKIEKEKLYNYIEIKDISSYTNEIINFTQYQGEDLPSRASYIIETNDILIATAGNLIGTNKHAKALVTKKYDKCICSNGITVLKSNKYSPYFMINFFNSKSFLTQISRLKYGTTIPTVTKEDFENILVPIPDEKQIIQIENRIKTAYQLREKAQELFNETNKILLEQ